MARTDRDITADGLEEIDARLSSIEKLLQQILSVCTTTADGLGQHQHHTRDSVSRRGERVLNVENRASALERLVPRMANGGE